MLKLLLLLILWTSALEPTSLGVPCQDKAWYARNIWDMQLFDERLYIGCGNSSNGGPAQNAGPIPIWSYYPGSGWQSEFVVDEEQIDRYLVLDEMLSVPGHDSREGWELGNWYTLEPGGWVKYRNIPNGVHVYDMTEFQGLLFAGLGTANGETLAISADGGLSWSTQVIPAGSRIDFTQCETIVIPASRIYGFFVVGETLYANTEPLTTDECVDGTWTLRQDGPTVLEWNGEEMVPSELEPYPDVSADRIVRPHVFMDRTVYIAAQSVNDHQWRPISLFAMDANGQAARLSLANCNRPQDIDIANDALVVLCNEQAGDGWLVSVYSTCDLNQWEQLLTIDSLTFARSFAIAPDGQVFFGLGADEDAREAPQSVVGQVLQTIVQPLQRCSS